MLLNGTIIGGIYQIINMIGSGGTGEVYLSYHTRLEKYVVIKKIKDNFVGKVDARAEVDILKGLKHTYLPQVYDFIQIGTQIYTVMEYIDGTDLSWYIKNGYFVDESTIIKWLRQLCDVLEYLHFHNPPIIHSDIKPENIMITTEGNVCLIDFNISLDGDDSSQIKGISLPYAAPEQYEKAMRYARGLEYRDINLDGRCDMYSLGATFYSLVTGQKPAMPYENFIYLSSWELPYSSELIEIIETAMMPAVNDRYPDITCMKNRLTAIYKKSSKYRKLMMTTIVSSVSYVAIVCLAIILIVKGYLGNIKEHFNTDSISFYNMYDSGEYLQAIDLGISILNNDSYRKNLNIDSNRSQLLHTIGEADFEIEDYDNAVYYYGLAISESDVSNDLPIYYRDYIVALLRNGQTADAEAWISNIDLYIQDDRYIKYVNAEYLVKTKNYDEAISQIDDLINSDLNSQDRLHILILGSEAANNLNNYDKQLEYLKSASEIQNNIGITRKLANAYISMAGKIESNAKSRECYQKAQEMYEKICDSTYYSMVDSLNLSICYRALQKYNNSISVLKKIENDTDYRVPMNMALTYYCKGDSTNAYRYALKCIKLYNNTVQEQRESEGSDNIQNIKYIIEKYG